MTVREMIAELIACDNLDAEIELEVVTNVHYCYSTSTYITLTDCGDNVVIEGLEE